MPGFFKERQKVILVSAILITVVVCAVVLIVREKGEPPSETNRLQDTTVNPAGTGAAKKPEPLKKKRVVLTLRIEPAKKTYKLGEPIILRATLQKNGDPVSLLEMRELVNIRATGTLEPKDGSGMKQLSPPVGAFVLPKGRKPNERKEPTTEQREEYAKLYPSLLKPSDSPSEPFPQRKHFYDMPKGVFSLKKEIHLEKLLMITQAGKITFRLGYDNSVDFYLEGRQRVGIDA